ncbi:MAG: hypothetical protein ACFFD2_26920 [Promethearchaeota archaeon]
MYVYRYWSEFCIYITKFEKKTDEYNIIKALVNRDEEQFGNEKDEIDIDVLNLLIDGLLYS